MPEYGERSNRVWDILLLLCIRCTMVYNLSHNNNGTQHSFPIHVHNTRSLILVFRIKFHGVLSHCDTAAQHSTHLIRVVFRAESSTSDKKKTS